MAVSTRLPRLQFCIFLDSAYRRICSAPHIRRFRLTTPSSRRYWPSRCGRERMTADDWRALSPLIYHHVNPYGRIELDMNRRLPLAA
jgi:hypothetical protein